MAALIEAARRPLIPGRDRLVLSNRPDAQAWRALRQPGSRTAVVDHRALPDRASSRTPCDCELGAQRDIELVCLAGFMRMLTPWFIERWQGG